MARHWAEELAKDYLTAQGYRCLAENYTVRGAELDLVMMDQEVIVMVEVRQRKSSQFGSAAESISAVKLRRMRHAALHYLLKHYQRDDVPVRFDAVLISGTQQKNRLEHLQNITG